MIPRPPEWTSEQMGMVRKKLAAGETAVAVAEALGPPNNEHLVVRRARSFGMSRPQKRAHHGTSKLSDGDGPGPL